MDLESFDFAEKDFVQSINRILGEASQSGISNPDSDVPVESAAVFAFDGLNDTDIALAHIDRRTGLHSVAEMLEGFGLKHGFVLL
jgi:hypothetical protein